MKEYAYLRRLLVLCLVLSVTLPVVFSAQASTPPISETSVAQEPEQVYREGFLAGCPLSSLHTGCAHRLDIYVNEPLVAITWEGGLKPLLAESYEMQEDGKVWIFHLRENATWHDGEVFTSDDVLFSMNAYADPAVGSRRNVWTNAILGYEEFQAGEVDSLTGVTAVDDHTVRVELANPSPLWIKIQLPYLVMFPEHILRDVPRGDLIGHSYWENRIGTGPFKWADYAVDQYIELVRNDDWYLGAPKLEKIILQVYGDAASHIAALERGEVDTTAYETTYIGMDDVERIDALENIDVVVMDKGSSAFIRFNHDDPLFADARVRQAIRYAIDVDMLMETIYIGGRAAHTMYPQTWTFPDGMNTYPYDPDKARELLAEAGWPSGREVDFIYYFTDTLTADLVVAIQAYLADVGVNINPRLVDSAVQMDLLANNTLEMGLFGFGMGTDPSIGDGNLTCGAMLAQGYCNEELDELFTLGASLNDSDERVAVYQEISTILNRDLPAVWLWYDLRPLGFNRRVVGPYEHYAEQGTIFFNMPVYNEVETWYIAE